VAGARAFVVFVAGWSDRVQHGACEFVLNVEDVAHLRLAIVPLRPYLTAVGGIDQEQARI